MVVVMASICGLLQPLGSPARAVGLGELVGWLEEGVLFSTSLFLFGLPAENIDHLSSRTLFGYK